MHTSWTNLLDVLDHNGWLVHASIILIAGLFLLWLERFIFNRLHPRLSRTSQIWDDSLLVALHRPLVVLISVVTLVWILDVLMRRFYSTEVLPDLDVAYRLCTILFLTWFGLRYVYNLQCEMEVQVNLGRRRTDKTTISALSQIAQATIITIAMLVALQTWGISISALLAFGGVGGLVVGFAAKDTLANFVGGLMVYLDRPFNVGDAIRSPDRFIEGTVEQIGWRLTRIRTAESRPLYIPNGTFSTISLENVSRMKNRRMSAEIGLRHEDYSKIKAILTETKEMLSRHPDVDSSEPILVNLVEVGEYALNFSLVAFIKTTEWGKFLTVQQDILLKTLDIISKHGAQCASSMKLMSNEK